MVDRKPALIKGRYQARFAQGPAAVKTAQALRRRCFAAPGADRFDDISQHLLVTDLRSSTLVCCCRVRLFADGAELLRDGYSAQFYDLSGLRAYGGRIAEIGRFCIHPDWRDSDILRIAWGALTGLVDDNHVDLLVGCTSFPGIDPTPYWDCFALLARRFPAPERWQPRVKAPEVIPFVAAQEPPAVRGAGLRNMPPLLRSYLSMGGWVSDHAVVDREMNTLHVFTGVEVGRIPAARKRLLRATAR